MPHGLLWRGSEAIVGARLRVRDRQGTGEEEQVKPNREIEFTVITRVILLTLLIVVLT